MIFKLRGVISVMRRIHTRWLVLALVMTIALVSASFTGLVRATNDRVDSSSRLVTIYDHELEKTIITKSRTVKQALADAKIRVGRHDQVSPSLSSQLSRDSNIINIKRARPVTIVDEKSVRTRVMTAETDINKVSEQAGVKLRSHDIAQTTPIDSFLDSGGIGQVVEITRAKTVNLRLYGQRLTLRTQQKTIAGMLKEANIKLGASDTMSLPQQTGVSDGMDLQVWRNGVQTVDQVEAVPFETKVIEDAGKKLGYHEVQTAGHPGKKMVIYQVNMQNGVEVARQKISEVVTEAPIVQVEIKGTKVELPPGSHTDWMAMAGIAESDYGAVNYIISHESGWRVTAKGMGGAYGLPQALPGSKMGSVGADWATNPITQLRWFKQYCDRRYGGIQGAYAHWLKYHSY